MGAFLKALLIDAMHASEQGARLALTQLGVRWGHDNPAFGTLLLFAAVALAGFLALAHFVGSGIDRTAGRSAMRRVALGAVPAAIIFGMILIFFAAIVWAWGVLSGAR